MLEVLAVHRVDDTVGANELDGTVNVDIYHCATLTVLEEEGNIPQGCHRRSHQDTPYLHSSNQADLFQIGVGAHRLKSQDGMGIRDSQLSACVEPHPGAPQSGPLVSAVNRRKHE